MNGNVSHINNMTRPSIDPTMQTMMVHDVDTTEMGFEYNEEEKVGGDGNSEDGHTDAD